VTAAQANVDAERAVLGALLVDPGQCGPVFAVATPDMFVQHSHRVLAAGLLQMHQGGTLMSEELVYRRLVVTGQLEEAGGAGYLRRLREASGGVEDAVHHAYGVRDAWTRRVLVAKLQRLQQAALDPAVEFGDVIAGLVAIAGEYPAAAGPLPATRRPVDQHPASAAVDEPPRPALTGDGGATANRAGEDRHRPREPERRPFTVRLARWSATHPWRAIAIWVLFVAACLVSGSQLHTKHVDVEGVAGEAARAHRIVAAGHLDPPAKEYILVTSRGGALNQAAATAALHDEADRLRGAAEVNRVDGPVPASDGQAMMLQVTLTGSVGKAADRAPALREITTAVQRTHPDVRVEETGEASIKSAVNEIVDRDFKRAELLSLPVTLLILIVAFGAVIAAGVPVVLALSSVAGAMGLAVFASYLTPATQTTNSVILLLGMAVGVDYSLFYLRREREERPRARDHIDAVQIAAETSGHAVIVSGTAVIVSICGLYLAGDPTFSSMASGSLLVVLAAMIGSLTVLPAILVKLGRWVDRLRVPVLWRITTRRGEPRLWPALLRPALCAPRTTVLVSVAVLGALALPALGMKLKLSGTEDLPRSAAAMRSFDRLTAAFPVTQVDHVVAVRAQPGEADEVRAALVDLAHRAAGDPLFAVDATPRIIASSDGRYTVLQLATPYPSGSDAARRSLQQLRTGLIPATIGAVPGAEYAVGGPVAATVDYSANIKQKLPYVIGFVLTLTFVVMVLMFRTVVIALMTIVLNLLSVGASYGFVVLVFQGSWAERLLDFRSMNAVASWLPLFLFAMLFGLSMDYHVFMISRIREAVAAGLPHRDAVGQGLTQSAGAVTSAAIIMVGVFAIFATLSLIDLKQLGIGLAAAVLLDATIIRALVMPSMLVLLGRTSWWMPRFRRSKRPRRPAPTEDTPVAPMVPVR
jgi:RND superfamily putative drug exporter